MTWRIGSRNHHTLYEDEEPRGFLLDPAVGQRVARVLTEHYDTSPERPGIREARAMEAKTRIANLEATLARVRAALRTEAEPVAILTDVEDALRGEPADAVAGAILSACAKLGMNQAVAEKLSAKPLTGEGFGHGVCRDTINGLTKELQKSKDRLVEHVQQNQTLNRVVQSLEKRLRTEEACTVVNVAEKHRLTAAEAQSHRRDCTAEFCAVGCNASTQLAGKITPAERKAIAKAEMLFAEPRSRASRETCPCGDGTRPGHPLGWCGQPRQ